MLSDLLPKLLAGLDKADCACGSRVEARGKGDGFVRVASSRIANGIRNKLSGETITDAGCCYRAFKRECIAEVKFFNGGHRFLPTLIKMEGFSVIEVPISIILARPGRRITVCGTAYSNPSTICWLCAG